MKIGYVKFLATISVVFLLPRCIKSGDKYNFGASEFFFVPSISGVRRLLSAAVRVVRVFFVVVGVDVFVVMMSNHMRYKTTLAPTSFPVSSRIFALFRLLCLLTSPRHEAWSSVRVLRRYDLVLRW